ncbi:hypothetical protein BDK51DRAFT_31340, partial [Blyttiomyces helicus]
MNDVTGDDRVPHGVWGWVGPANKASSRSTIWLKEQLTVQNMASTSVELTSVAEPDIKMEDRVHGVQSQMESGISVESTAVYINTAPHGEDQHVYKLFDSAAIETLLYWTPSKEVGRDYFDQKFLTAIKVTSANPTVALSESQSAMSLRTLETLGSSSPIRAPKLGKASWRR